jgi:hypothetical protein
MKPVRRHAHDPIFSENPFGSVAHKVLPVASNGENLEILYYRTGWRRLDLDTETIKRRHTAALIILDGQRVGSLQANEFRVSSSLISNEFLYEMDNHSQETFNLADVICANWESIWEISDYGDIVELSGAWMSAPFSRRGRFSAAVNVLIQRLFKGRSLLILKAFPLEYEGRVTGANAGSFHRRQKAMKRHYERILGVSPFPGADGENGWMYSVPDRFNTMISPPTGRRE